MRPPPYFLSQECQLTCTDDTARALGTAGSGAAVHSFDQKHLSDTLTTELPM